MSLTVLTEEAWRLLEAKGFRVGTVRKWASGDVVKTATGWQPVQVTVKVKKPKKPKLSKPSPSPSPTVPPNPPPSSTVPPKKVKPPKVPLAVPSSKKSDEFRKQVAKFADALEAVGADTKSKEKQAVVRDGLELLLNDFGITARHKHRWMKFDDGDKSRRYRIKGEKPYGLKSLRGSLDPRTRKMWIAKEVHDRALKFAKLQSSPAFKVNAMSDEELEAANAFRTLVHEQLHGAHPAEPETYKGLGVAWEEALTELSARKVMVDTFGVDSKDMHDVGSYSEFVRAMRKGVQEARLANGLPDLDYPSFFAYLSEAALATKRDTTDVRAGNMGLFDLKERFAENLSVPEDWDEVKAQNYRADAWDFIERWFKKTSWAQMAGVK